MRPSTEVPPQRAQSECRQKNEVDLHKCGAPKSAADLAKAGQMSQRRKRAPPAKRQVQSQGKQEGNRTSDEHVPPPAAALTWWQGRNGSEQRQQQEDNSRKQSLCRRGWVLSRRERENRPGRPQKEEAWPRGIERGPYRARIRAYVPFSESRTIKDVCASRDPHTRGRHLKNVDRDSRVARNPKRVRSDAQLGRGFAA